MNTTNIFAQTIYEVEFPDFETIQQSLVTNLINNYTHKYNGHDHPNKGGLISMIYDQSSNIEISDPTIQTIRDFINLHGKEYWNVLNFSKFLNPYVLQLWVNTVKKGGFTSSHNHNPVPIAGVFYINSRPELGNLFLENPLDLVLGKSAYHSETRTPTRFNYEVQATSGKLVLFPGWMKHFTTPNPTDETRISMAVNIGCYGQVIMTESF
jgi:uncharacterized protein (TIGR02466 family)